MAGIPRKRPSGLGYVVLEDSSTGAGAGEVSGDMVSTSFGKTVRDQNALTEELPQRRLNELPTRGVVGLGVEVCLLPTCLPA